MFGRDIRQSCAWVWGDSSVQKLLPCHHDPGADATGHQQKRNAKMVQLFPNQSLPILPQCTDWLETPLCWTTNCVHGAVPPLFTKAVCFQERCGYTNKHDKSLIPGRPAPVTLSPAMLGGVCEFVNASRCTTLSSVPAHVSALRHQAMYTRTAHISKVASAARWAWPNLAT